MKRAWLAAGLLLGGASLPVQAAEPVPAVESRVVSCCRDGFSIANIVRAFPLRKPPAPSFRFTVVTVEEPTGRIGGYDIAWETYQRQALQASKRESGLAYILETKEGAGAVLWDPVHGRAESKILRGRDPFAVTPTVTLLHLCWDKRRDGRGVMAYAWARQPLGAAESGQILTEVRRQLGGARVELFVSESPFLWTADSFPLLVPAFGQLAADAMEKARHTGIFRCTWADGADGPGCARYIE